MFLCKNTSYYYIDVRIEITEQIRSLKAEETQKYPIKNFISGIHFCNKYDRILDHLKNYSTHIFRFNLNFNVL